MVRAEHQLHLLQKNERFFLYAWRPQIESVMNVRARRIIAIKRAGLCALSHLIRKFYAERMPSQGLWNSPAFIDAFERLLLRKLKAALGSRARSRVARKLPFGVIPAPMAGDDSIPVVGASGCHRLQWPIMHSPRLCEVTVGIHTKH